MKRQKVMLLLAMLVLFISVGTAASVNAATISTSRVNDDTILNANYSFTFGFINGETTTETGGMTNNVVDANNASGVNLNNYYSARLTSGTQKGNIWIKYKNVGTYKGQAIDLKITLKDWDYLQSANTGANSYPTVFFAKDKIGAYITTTPAVCEPIFKGEFFISGTNTPIIVRGYQTFIDIEEGQAYSPVTGFDYVYMESGTHLNIDSSKVYANVNDTSTEDEKTHWATGVINGNSFEFKYHKIQDIYSDTTYRDVMQPAGSSKYVYKWEMIDASVAPFEYPIPTKVADKTMISGTDSVRYTVTQDIPYEYSDFYYDSYIFKDEIADCYAIKQITVIDAYGIDRTGWFNITVNGSDITASATTNALANSGFYNNTLNFIIDVQKRAGYDLKDWMNRTVCRIPNVANITINAQNAMYNSRTEKVTSNIVNVDCTFDIVTNIQNGTITPTRYKQPAGSAQSVTFTPAIGYYITSIIIDGVEQDLDMFNITGSNTYTFYGVSVDHNIDVVCSPRRVNFIVNKSDAKTGSTTQGDATFKDAVYGVYTDEACRKLATKVTLDENGNGLSDKEVDVARFVNGKYEYYEDFYIKEITAPVGYNLDDTVYHVSFDVTELTDIVTTLTARTKDTIISNSINLVKYIEKTDSVLKHEIEGAVFKATLDSDPTKTYSATTDERGRATIKNLPYGTYTVIEEVIPSIAFDGQFTIGNSTVRVKKFSVFIQEDSSVRGPYEYSDITNVAKKMNVTVYLLDAETGTRTQGDAHLEGAQYSLYTNEDCTDESKIQTITIQKNSDGTYSATSGWYLVGTYYIKQTKAPIGYNIDEQVYTVSQDSVAQAEEYSVHSITSNNYVKRNNIEINKFVDETDSTEKQPLSGAVFTATLKSKSSVFGVSTETDENGHCVISDLPYGTYTIRETTVPPVAYNAEFYVEGSENRTQTFSQFIEEDKKDREPYIYTDINDVPKKMNITVYLEDAETQSTPQGDAHLEGAEFTLYSDVNCTEESKIETITTVKQSNGRYSVTSGWYLVGTYYVKQTKAPEGYLIDNNVYTISQDPTEQITEFKSLEVIAKDYVKRNNIDITKNIETTFTSEKQALKGAKFTASLDSNTNYRIESTETDENGNCVIAEVPYGHYTIKETVVPDTAFNGEFYVGDSTTRTDNFKQFVEEDKTERSSYVFADITDIAKKMQITINKEDSETGNKTQGDATLAGAEYTLYSDPELTNEIETITIEENKENNTWSATSNWYLVGTYWLKETKAPEGYLIDENVYTVEQKPAEQTTERTSHSVTSKDKVREGVIRVVKYSNNSETGDKQPAIGAKLRLSLTSNPDVYYDAIIDEKGYAEFVDIIDDKHYSSTETHCGETCYPYTIPYGKYAISAEAVSDKGENIFIYKQSAEIREQDQISRYILDEEYVRMRLTVQNQDSETDASLKGAKFKIWDVANQRWYTERVYGSGEYVSEFTVNDYGYFTIKGYLEAGTYVLYQTKAPYGYYVDENMVEGTKGYEFTVGVSNLSQVVVTHDDEQTILQKVDEVYEGVPVRMYPHTVTIKNEPQKAVITVTDLAKQFTHVLSNASKYGATYTPIFDEIGLAGVEFDIIAKEDIITEYGVTKYNAGDVVAHLATGSDGKCATEELYLGKYQVVQTKVPNGYVLDSRPRDLDIEYTAQTERVQDIQVQLVNRKQSANIVFEKIFDRIYEEIYMYEPEKAHAIYGIYSAETLKDYKGQNVLTKDELIEVIDSTPGHKIMNAVDLPAGKYYMKELASYNPYELSKEKYEFTIEFTTTADENVEVAVNGGKITDTNGIVSLELLVFPQDAYQYYNMLVITDKNRLEDLAGKYGLANRTYALYDDEECTIPTRHLDGENVTYTTDEIGRIYIDKMPTGTYYLREVSATTGNPLSNKVFKVQLDTSKDFYLEKLVEGARKGDMNVDGFVNSTDAALVLDKFKTESATELDFLRGDMDENNMLNSTDAAMILDIFKNN